MQLGSTRARARNGARLAGTLRPGRREEEGFKALTPAPRFSMILASAAGSFDRRSGAVSTAKPPHAPLGRRGGRGSVHAGLCTLAAAGDPAHTVATLGWLTYTGTRLPCRARRLTLTATAARLPLQAAGTDAWACPIAAGSPYSPILQFMVQMHFGTLGAHKLCLLRAPHRYERTWYGRGRGARVGRA